MTISESSSLDGTYLFTYQPRLFVTVHSFYAALILWFSSDIRQHHTTYLFIESQILLYLSYDIQIVTYTPHV